MMPWKGSDGKLFKNASYNLFLFSYWCVNVPPAVQGLNGGWYVDVPVQPMVLVVGGMLMYHQAILR